MFTEFFIPMGASSGDILHPILQEPGVWLEHKWNGHRAGCVIDEHGEVHFYSAVESKKDGQPQGFLTENTDALPHLVAQLQGLPKGTWLDGELVTSLTEPSDSHKVTSLLKPKKGVAVERQAESGQLHFVVFDLIFVGLDDMRDVKNEDRFKRLLALLNEGEIEAKFHRPNVHVTERYFDNFGDLLAEWQAAGFEGGIVKRPSGKIRTRPMGKSGKSRSTDWIKIKVQKAEYDVVPMAVTFPHPTSLKSGATEETPNKFYERKQISGMVFGQYVPTEKYDEKTAQRVLQGYFRRDETWLQVQDTINRYKIDGYVLQPMGVFGNFTDELRARVSASNGEEWVGKVVVRINAYHRYEDTGYFQHPNMIGGEPRIDKNTEHCTYDGEAQS